MTLTHAPTGRPGIGWTVFQVDVPGINRTGGSVSAGAVLALDFANDGDAADNNEDGGNDSGFACLITPTDTYGSESAGALLQEAGILAVVLETMADDAEADVRLAGTVDINVRGDSNAIAKADRLILDIGTDATALVQIADAQVTTTYKVYGIALAASSADENIACIFDGVGGLGVYTTLAT